MTAHENLVTQKEKTATTLPKGMPLAQTVTLVHGNGTHQQPTEMLTNFLYRQFSDAKSVESAENGNSTFKLLAPQNTVVMQFCMEGNCVYSRNQQKKLVSFKNAEYNLLFVPKGELDFAATTEHFNFINIYLGEDFFFRYIPKGYNFPSTNMNGLVKMFPKNFYIGPKLKSILNEIIASEFNGHLKQLYIKAKIIELLTLQLAQYEEEKSTSAALKPIEVEKMMVVKELIENNISETHSIASLARAAGTNEQYLKKHFKLLFGNTVFGHIISCKMQKAKDLLLTGKYRVVEIAEMVGYKHATHFTSAFKKFFGYLPQTLKTIIGGWFPFTFELEAIAPLLYC